MSTTNAPPARDYHATVWTGTEFIVWGGALNNGTNDGGNPILDGGIYNPIYDSWMLTPTANAPVARDSAAAIWTGKELILWGGRANGTYIGDAYALRSDQDGDGIADIYETNAGIYESATNTGTNPHEADTDGDGINDGTEITKYGSNPNLKDSDGDGFDDHFEVFTGFDPTQAGSSPETESAVLPAVEYRFNAASGVSYRIESSPDLVNWSTVEADIIGNGSPVVRFFSIENHNHKFYRSRRN